LENLFNAANEYNYGDINYISSIKSALNQRVDCA